jgi:DNA-binding GntR family transcriptional regulator
MAAKRGEPFQLALAELRRRLCEGAYPPGARLAAAEVAGELGLSATPVREALARLAGEGLLDERRGEGAFVPGYSGPDVADLYRLGLAHLEAALRIPGGGAPRLQATAMRPEDAAAAVTAADRLLAEWIAGAAGRRLTQSFLRLQRQLGPVRRLEPRCFSDLLEEWLDLAGAGEPRERLALGRAFYRRRVRAAARLADLSARATDRPAL